MREGELALDSVDELDVEVDEAAEQVVDEAEVLGAVGSASDLTG